MNGDKRLYHIFYQHSSGNSLQGFPDGTTATESSLINSTLGKAGFLLHEKNYDNNQRDNYLLGKKFHLKKGKNRTIRKRGKNNLAKKKMPDIKNKTRRAKD